MTQHLREIAITLLYYLEQEETRLNSLRAVLARLHACLVKGELTQLNAVLDEFLTQAKCAESLWTEWESLKNNLPSRSDGSVDWLALEAGLPADMARSLCRQRERLRQLAIEIQRDLRRAAVLAWFGQELYGRMLAAILNGHDAGSGNYDRLGQPNRTSCGPLIQLLG